jgi:hypothetical protein
MPLDPLAILDDLDDEHDLFWNAESRVHILADFIAKTADEAAFRAYMSERVTDELSNTTRE